MAGAHRKRESLYHEARERLFDFLADRLLPHRLRPGGDPEIAEDWPARIRSFLGYAPVLETIAEYLASYANNYQALISDLSAMESDPYNSGNAQLTMLRRVVWRLLKREQGKVVTQLRKLVPDSEATDWEQIYGPDEQCRRVLGRITGVSELADPPTGLPEQILARHREVLKNAVPNHPFLGGLSGYANVVFRDYVHAWGLLSPVTAARASVRAALHADDYLPSPLLGPFVVTGAGDQVVATIAGPDLGFVYESLLTHGEDGFFLFGEPGAAAKVFIGGDPSAEVALLDVSSSEGSVRFWRRLSHASIEGELAVQLGLPGRGFSLGPGVRIDVSIIEIPCRAVRVYTNPREQVEMYASQGYIAGDVEADLYKFGHGKLAVWWDAIRYPWVEYAKQPSAAEVINYYEIHEAFLNLTRVVRSFAAPVYNMRPLWGPSATLFTKSHYATRSRNQDQLQRMLTWMTAEGIIQARSGLYYMDPARWGAYGIRLFDLLTRRETPEALQLVERFIQ